MESLPVIATTILQRFTDLAAGYAAVRPHPPALLGTLLPQLARTAYPSLVVDLGCGPGLSTCFWADKTAQVIGIEPVDAMRAQAVQQTTAPHVTYRAGFGHQTGLPTGCADLVTCAQALHWMDPQPTFAEIARITRPGGVFAAYDYAWPPTLPSWEAERAYQAFRARVAQLEAAQPEAVAVPRWAKAQHLRRMQASGCFRSTKALLVHQADTGNADRLLALAWSQGRGHLATLMRQGYSAHDLGLDTLEAVARQTLGDTLAPWYWSYHVRIGIV